MPRKSPKASKFEEMRDAGIGLAAKLELEHKYDQAKDVFLKLLDLRPDDDTSFIAPCGMNCSICMAYLREKNKCSGCRGADVNKAVTRAKCKIKNCIIFQTSEAKYCFECEKFPCDNLKHLDKRYRTKYNMSMVENLENIRNFGIRTFLGNEKKKWTCSECGGTICVHKGYCYSCGKKNRI